MGLYDESWCVDCGKSQPYSPDDVVCGNCTSDAYESRSGQLYQYMNLHLISLMQDTDKLKALNALKTTDPKAYNAELMGMLGRSIKEQYNTNANYEPTWKQFAELQASDPQAWYKQQLDFLGHQVGWQQGQNTSERSAAIQPQIQDTIAQATDYLTQLEDTKRSILQSMKPQAFNAPGMQQGFEFGAADENTQRAIEMTETPEFALAQQTGALPTGDVEKVEALPEGPKSKMMLIGQGANPLAPLKAFLKSLKTATNAPQQVRDYNAEVNNLIEDVL